MATFNQRSDALKGYVSPVDVDTYGKVLIGLQAGYDKNVGELNKVEEQLKSIAQNTNLRPEAKEYFYKRMRERKDVLEKNMGNFAFANELDYGMKVLSSAVDDNVAIEQYNGLIYNKIGAEYKKLAESKHPELANSVNLEYSLQDWNKFMNSGAPVGTKFQGNSTYVPYVDIVKAIDTEVKRQIPDAFAIATESGLQIKTSEGKFLSPARVKEIVDMARNSNPQIAKQLEINGWNQYRGVGDDDFLAGVKGKLSEFVKNYEASAKAEESRTAGATLLEGTPVGEDAKRSKAYNENAAKYYKKLLYGEDGKSGLMAMKSLSVGDRRQLETLLTHEEIKDNAAQSFAYFAVNKSDIKLNEAATFQASYAQKQEEIKIKDFDAQTARIKAIKDLNPNATYDDLVKGGVSPDLALSSIVNPDNVIMEPIELKKTESYQESVTALNSQRDGVYSELGDMAEKLTIMQYGDKTKGSQQRRKWTNKEYDGSYREALLETLRQKPNMKESESKMINQMLEKLDDLDRYNNLEKEIKTGAIVEEGGRKIKLAPVLKDGEVDISRFRIMPNANYQEAKAKGYDVNLWEARNDRSSEKYLDSETNQILSKREAQDRSQVPQNVDVSKYLKVSNNRYIKRGDKSGTTYSLPDITRHEYFRDKSSQVGTSLQKNINKIAEEKHGILLLASAAGEVEIKDINMIAKALKSVNDSDLISYGLTDAKGLKEAIDKSIAAKDGKEFPIQSLKIKSDGTATIVKSDGDEVQLKGYTEGSTIGQVINSFRQNVYNQQLNARNSVALIADARKPSGKVYTKSINGKTAIVEINANSNSLWAKINYNGQEYNVADSSGEVFIPIGNTLAEKANLKIKIEALIDAYINNLKSKSGEQQ